MYDLFIVRPANKSNLSKDLETQQEVVISMLLRLLQHHQVAATSLIFASYGMLLVWNNLPVYIRAEPDITRFKNILKTYFFRLAFDLLG